MWSVRFVAAAGVAGGAGWRRARPRHRNFRTSRYATSWRPVLGGASDIIARTLGPPLSEGLGVQIVIDNRAGAGNTVGAEIAARAPPDGYTLLSCNIASLAVGPALYKKLGYDPERDFAPLGMIVSNPNVFTVHPSLPARSIAQFIALAKANPGKLNYASAGIGTSPQLSMELFRMETGIRIVHVPVQRRRTRPDRPDGRPCRSHDFDSAGGAGGRARPAKSARSVSRRCSAIRICRTCRRSPSRGFGTSRSFRGRACAPTQVRHRQCLRAFARRSLQPSSSRIRASVSWTRAFNSMSCPPRNLLRSSAPSERSGRKW